MIENGIKVCNILRKNGFEAYFVGGCIRDMKMNTNMKDIDITTNALPEDVQRIFPMHINTGIAHGTVSVKPIKESEYYEVTTYRVDGKYDDGRHPNNVTFTLSLEDDLSRRDFTINAIAYDPIAKITVDPFNGESDIKDRVIRCVGDAKSRFMEDPLRVLRAIRFAVRYGFFIDESTKNAMHDTEVLNKLTKCVSKERITDELKKILTYNKPIRDIFMEFSDIICRIIPDMRLCINSPHNSIWHRHDIYDHILHVVDMCDTDSFEIKLAALLHDIGKPASRVSDEHGDHFYGHPEVSVSIAQKIFKNNLVVSNNEKLRVLKLIELHDIYINDSPKAMTRLLANHGEQFIRDWMILKFADLSDHIAPTDKIADWNATWNRFNNFKSSIDEIIANANALKISDLAINGTDVINILNIKPGPKVGIILKNIFDDVLDEKIINDRKTLLEHIKTLV